MKLEFKTYKVNENNRIWRAIVDSFEKANKPIPENRFVIVGKRKEYYLVQHDDMLVIADIKITETAYMIKRQDLIRIPNEYAEYDIPRMNLTMKIIEDIQRLNED